MSRQICRCNAYERAGERLCSDGMYQGIKNWVDACIPVGRIGACVLRSRRMEKTWEKSWRSSMCLISEGPHCADEQGDGKKKRSVRRAIRQSRPYDGCGKASLVRVAAPRTERHQRGRSAGVKTSGTHTARAIVTSIWPSPSAGAEESSRLCAAYTSIWQFCI